MLKFPPNGANSAVLHLSEQAKLTKGPPNQAASDKVHKKKTNKWVWDRTTWNPDFHARDIAISLPRV
jgi:hypothetical protein